MPPEPGAKSLGAPQLELDSQLFWEGWYGSRSLPRAESEGYAAQSRGVKNFAHKQPYCGDSPPKGALVA